MAASNLELLGDLERTAFAGVAIGRGCRDRTLPEELAHSFHIARLVIAERTRKGREAAQARRIKFGPKPRFTDELLNHGRALVEQGRPIRNVVTLLHVHRTMLYRAPPN